MRQRNDTGYPLLVAADPPFTVEDGETVDHPEPVAGLTNLDADDAPEEFPLGTGPDEAAAVADPDEIAEQPRPRRRRNSADADGSADTPGGQL